MRARHRLSKLLLRHGHVYALGDRGRAWSLAHDRWLRQLRSDESTGWSAGTRSAFDSCYETVTMVTARQTGSMTRSPRWPPTASSPRLKPEDDSEFTPITRRLGCLRRISTLTGFALAIEIGDWSRFTGKTIGSFVGLTPSSYQNGANRGVVFGWRVHAPDDRKGASASAVDADRPAARSCVV